MTLRLIEAEGAEARLRLAGAMDGLTPLTNYGKVTVRVTNKARRSCGPHTRFQHSTHEHARALRQRAAIRNPHAFRF